MEAHEGDHLLVEGTKVGQGRRSGEVVRTEGDRDHQRLWVRWDDGHESLFVPGPGVKIQPKK